ncbi:uncharacterized protein DS421_3g83730 [Arachis hypogaea]|nr:uncharacterized protein DS421_3g83730 [Arachis hypogaea]
MAPRGLLPRRHVQLAVATHRCRCHQQRQERQKELARETATARRNCTATTDEGEGSRGHGLGTQREESPSFVTVCAAVHTSIVELHVLLTSRSPCLTIGSQNLRKERNHRILPPAMDLLSPTPSLTNRRTTAGANHHCQAPHRCFDCQKLPSKLLLFLSPVHFNFWLCKCHHKLYDGIAVVGSYWCG